MIGCYNEITIWNGNSTEEALSEMSPPNKLAVAMFALWLQNLVPFVFYYDL